MPIRSLAGTSHKEDSSSKDGQHRSVAALMSFKIPHGRNAVRQGRSAGVFDGMLPSPSNPLRAPSAQSAQVHFELRHGSGACQQPNLLQRDIFRSGGHVDPAGVRQEATRHNGVLERVSAGFTKREVAPDQDKAGHHRMSAGMGGMSNQGPARTRGSGPGVKTGTVKAWRVTQQR